jgi:putative transposase
MLVGYVCSDSFSGHSYVVLSIPIQINRRSDCKKVLLPNGEKAKPKAWDTKTTPLQLAIARGHRWVAMLESDEVMTCSL